MQCVILAGGKGTRMYPLTVTSPKALIPVAGRPFIEHQLTQFASQGITDILLSIGHLGHMIEDCVKDGAHLGVRVRYVREDGPLLGTAGALRLALEAGALQDSFILTYGDSYLPVDVKAVVEAFRARAKPALMTVFRNDDQWDTSNVIFDETQAAVTLYDKSRSLRPGEYEYIDYGLSVLQRDVVETLVPPTGAYDLAEVFRQLSLQGALTGYRVTQRFYEIGSPSGLKDLEAFLAG